MFLDFKIFEIATNDNFVIANFTRRVYLINELKIKMLIDNDILSAEKNILDLDKKQMIIDSC